MKFGAPKTLSKFPYAQKKHRVSGIGSCLALSLYLILSCYSPLSFAQIDKPKNNDEAISLIRHIEDMYRSNASFAALSMEITTPHWQRTMHLEAWSKGTEKSLIRILSPKKDAGISTLKIDSEMWNFFPKINKTIKVAPSMMMGSWMGSDFTNDDLVKESQLTEDYFLSLTKTDKHFEITLTPKENTATVWGKIVILIDKEGLLPVSQTYFNENGKAVRKMEYQNIKDFHGARLPSSLIMTPLNKAQHKTILNYQDLKLNLELKDDLFSIRSLKRRR